MRGRKPSKLKQATDTKLDGAYADLKAIPDDEYGGRTKQEAQIGAVQREVQQSGGAPSLSALPQYSPEDVLGKPTENMDESIFADSSKQQTESLPSGTNTQILLDIIQNNYGYMVRRRFPG
tara:strand:+ start:1167 stop:1529 length:363 start_codon:yes stop_codon:yes gene_type:complete